jgi:CO/xanthine dehydrogenase FAD-binding subunit
MPKRATAYYRPKTIEEALDLLTQPDTVPLAGGTSLLAGDVEAAVVDLQALGLDQIRVSEDEMYIGAMVRLADWFTYLADNFQSRSPAKLLQNAIHRAGPNTYRHAATTGGVAAARLPDSELLAAMLVLEGVLFLQSPEEQTISLADYLALAERPSGLITEIRLSWTSGQGLSERVARTPADYPIVSITTWQPDGLPPRLAATGIDDRPIRLKKSEEILAAGLTAEAVSLAAAAAAGRCLHPGDFRGDTAYRSKMAAVLTGRVLTAD